jgi:PAS domain S-box-containing protein
MDVRPTPSPRKPWLPVLVALVLLLGLGALMLWQWQALELRSHEEAERRFQLESQEVKQRVESRMRAYEMVLRGMSGLIVGSDKVSIDDWNRAVDQLRLQERYPGIQAVSWSSYLRAPQVEEFMADMQASGRKDFRIIPTEPSEEYLLVNYISPLDWRNRRAVGFNMLTTGAAVITGPLLLRQETDQAPQSGVILYLPVYRRDAPLTTAAERMDALRGMVGGTFRLNDLMEGILGAQSALFRIKIVDEQSSGSILLDEASTSALEPRFQVEQQLSLYGRTWLLSVSSTPEYEAVQDNRRLAFSLWMGLAAVVLLSLLVGGYLWLRERELSANQLVTAQLREREERFRMLIERLPVATLLCNSEGRIEMSNQSAAELLDCPQDALLGERVRRFLPQISDLTVLLRDGTAPAESNEYQASRDSGGSVPVALSLSVLTHESRASYLLNLVDLRARKEAEQRFRLVVEASPNAIVLVDSAGCVAMVNRQTEQMFGYERQELLGQPVERLLPQTLRGAHVDLRKAYQQSPEPRRMGNNRELFGQHRDGHLIPLEVGLSPIRSGKDVMVQAVIIDISERKAAEQRLRDQAEQLILANRYKSEFLANMSHELRTPLNSILILSDQLRQNSAGNLTEKQAKHADIVHRAGSDLLQLINDVLDLAKVEAGRLQLKLEPLNMQDMMVELDASLRPMAEIKGLRLSTRLEPGVPRVIHSDRVRLHQILRNLLSNALKFTDHGEVELVVSSQPCDDDDGRERMRFAVRDTGIGIPVEQHERIFQAFQQIDGSTSRRFGGTGLGLAITRQLVTALDGEIHLESTPGQGSCFIVELPVAVAVGLQGEVAVAEPQRKGQGSAVLIIEDDDNFAAVIADEAQNHGFATVHCRTGNQATQLLQGERFSAVILDILLPDISGWQIYRRLRSQMMHRGTPVHIISCVPQPVDWKEDGTRYLVKPIGREDLEQVFEGLRQGPETGHLLLVEDVEVEREHYRDHLQQLGFSVVAAASAEEARKAYGKEGFEALVIDLDLPDQDGFDLLEELNRQRPLNGARIVINTGVDVTQQNLQRLRRFSAVVVRKSGTDMADLSAAVQGFLTGVRDPQPSMLAPHNDNPLAGSRVLLVDDDVRNIYALSALLDEVGLKVTPARDGLEAIECYRREPFDLILMDMAMPNMDGYTATRVLKSEHGCSIPIIALTAHAMKGDREKCITAGADDYLAKPVGRQELLDLLGRWLSGLETPGKPWQMDKKRREQAG